MEGLNRIDGTRVNNPSINSDETHDLAFWVAAPGVRNENKCRVCAWFLMIST